ncbi:MAG: hypothetical protein K1V97_02975 [Lachnospiraceae bacterium]
MRKGMVAALIWQALMGIVSPIWCTFIFYFITGNGKGFGYDLRDEKIVYIYSGIFMLVIYILAVVPVFVYLIKLFRQKGKWRTLIPIMIFVVGCVCTISVIGWKDFFTPW